MVIVYPNQIMFNTCEKMTLKLVCDDKIPFISGVFTACNEIVSIPGESIQRSDLMDADLLLVRTVTSVNQKLLHDTPVKWVGSATTGTDHVDQPWLFQNQIEFADAAGANAPAVLEYVLACVASFKKQHYFTTKNRVVGVIGVGRIGSLVAQALKAHGFEVLCYDPLISNKPDYHFVSLKTLLCESHLITIHTPLTKTGLFPTYHMLDQKELSWLQHHAILLNTARGAVINQAALCENKNIIIGLDVWENEPTISLELLNRVTIGTPHIAGYSKIAKYRATQMVCDNAAEFFGWPKSKIILSNDNPTQTQCDPLLHTQAFRAAFQGQLTQEQTGKIFARERARYPLR